MVTVVDVASYILNKYGSLTTMKLQKLAYYSQAQSLVMTGRPLFDEDFQAWMNGPVVPSLFRLHKGRFFVDPGFFDEFGSPEKLSDEQKSIIDAVSSVLVRQTGRELSARTHDEDPWKDARGDCKPGDFCQTVHHQGRHQGLLLQEPCDPRGATLNLMAQMAQSVYSLSRL